MRFIHVFILFLSLLHLSSNTSGAVLYVGEGGAFSSVTKALANAKPFDTIQVKKGVYREGNIIISKPVVLMGVGMPILDGDKKYEVVSIKSSHVTLSGFEIRNSGVSSIRDLAGIKIYESSDVTISNNRIVDAFFGIYTQYGTRCTISNNRIMAHGLKEQQSGNGIHCWNCSEMKIVGNTISGHRDGIYFEFVKNSLIKGNKSYANMRYGLHFMFSNDDTYISNSFHENGAGVAVMFSKKVNMYNNDFKQNWGDASYGILLKEISDGTIKGNRFDENTSGIYMEGTSRLLLTKNEFVGNGWGLKIQASCMDIKIHENNFIGNTFDVSTNGTLVLNDFGGNYWDKYEGYDLNHDQRGDVPFRPVSLFSIILEKNPTAMIMFRSFISVLMDKTEKLIPSLTPEELKDDHPLMKPVKL